MIAYYDVEEVKGKTFGGVLNLENVTLFDVKVKEAKLLLSLDKWYISGDFEKVDTTSVIKLYDMLVPRKFKVKYRFNHKMVDQKLYKRYLQIEELMELIVDYIKCPDSKKKKVFEKKIFDEMYM